MTESRSEKWPLILSGGLALVLAGASARSGIGFCLDDAWIHIAYAQSLRLGDGWSYNPGDWETGSSSPLWVALLAVWPLGLDPVPAIKLLGGLLHCATAIAAARLARDYAIASASTERPVPVASISALAGTLVAATPSLVQGATSGMEVPLAAFLTLALARAVQLEQIRAGFVLALLGVWARPELLGFAASLSLARVLGSRARSDLAPLAGAVSGLVLWCSFNWVVSGFPWPNTAYVKVTTTSLDGWTYLSTAVLPGEPWLLGLGGIVLVGAALWSRGRTPGPLSNDLRPLLGAWLCTMVAIAASREFHPGVGYFEARYFAPFAAIPCVVVALGLASIPKWAAVAALIPVTIVTGLRLTETNTRRSAQELDVELLHVAPARWISHELPADARIAVEGAGALRALTPRGMTIIDVLGLNDRELAHVKTDVDRACVVAARQPSHFVLPEHIAAPLFSVFELRPLMSFEDPAYAQVDVPHPLRVLVLENLGTKPGWVLRCNQR